MLELKIDYLLTYQNMFFMLQYRDFVCGPNIILTTLDKILIIVLNFNNCRKKREKMNTAFLLNFIKRNNIQQYQTQFKNFIGLFTQDETSGSIL